MKTKFLYSIIFFALLLITACGSEKSIKPNPQRFSRHLDTSYKNNSLEIRSISRTFYTLEGKDNNPQVTLKKNIGENEFVIIINDRKNLAVSIFENDKELKKFFEDMKTVANNPDKSLNFDFGSLKGGYISYSNPEKKIMLYNTGLTVQDKSTFIYLDKSEIDSMQSCYNKYISEINK